MFPIIHLLGYGDPEVIDAWGTQGAQLDCTGWRVLFGTGDLNFGRSEVLIEGRALELTVENPGAGSGVHAVSLWDVPAQWHLATVVMDLAVDENNPVQAVELHDGDCDLFIERVRVTLFLD